MKGSDDKARSTRVVTSLVVSVPVFALLMLGGPFVLIMLVVPAVVISVEWALMSSGSDSIKYFPANRRIEALLLVGSTTLTVVMVSFGMLTTGMIVMFVALLCLSAVSGPGLKPPQIAWPIGPVYCALPFALAADLLLSHEHGQYILMTCMSLVWCGDIGAYYAGKKFGKHPLPFLKSVSPNKTIEGSIGGIVAGTLGGFYFLIFMPLPLWLVVLLPIFAIIAQAGDLLESAVKRAFGLKDSGALLPGHGGLMDRMDGFTILMPVVWALGALSRGVLWA